MSNLTDGVIKGKAIQCPECETFDSMFFEGVVTLPVGLEIEEWGDNDVRHFWDWENAEMVDERCYECYECGANFHDAEDFITDVS